MSKANKATIAQPPERTFTVNRSFLRTEAHEGLKTFFAPFTGIYRAATGSAASRKATQSPPLPSAEK